MARKRTGSLVYRPTLGWCAQVTATVDGEAVKKWYQLGTHDRGAAKRKLARLVAELAERVPGPDEALQEETFKAYALAWLQHRDPGMEPEERTNLTLHVLPEIGHLPLTKVGASDARGVLEACVKKGLRKGTIIHVRGVMNRVLKAAWRDDLVPSNVIEKVAMPKLREAKKERAILTDQEITTYLACPHVDVELRLMSLAARVEGGMRTGDVNRWDWAMIDRLHFAECIVPRAKTNKPQHLEIPEVLGLMLRERWHTQGCPETGPIFPVRRGLRSGEFKAERGISYAKALRRDLLRAGVNRHTCLRPANATPVKIGEACCGNMAHDPLFTETAVTRRVDFHSFRRAFSTALANAGVNAQQAMRLASHSDEKTHMRYVMTTPAMKAIPEGAVPKLPARLLAQKIKQLPVAFGRRAGRKPPMIPVGQEGLEPSANGLRDERKGPQPVPGGVNESHDHVRPRESSAQLLLPVAIQPTWLDVLCKLGPALASATLQLPPGAVDRLVGSHAPEGHPPLAKGSAPVEPIDLARTRR